MCGGETQERSPKPAERRRLTVIRQQATFVGSSTWQRRVARFQLDSASSRTSQQQPRQTVLFRRPPPADFPRREPTKRLPLEQAKLLHLLILRWIPAPKLQEALRLVDCSLPPQQARLAQKREAVQLLPRLWFPSRQANSQEPKKPVIRPSILLLVCLQQQRCRE